MSQTSVSSSLGCRAQGGLSEGCEVDGFQVWGGLGRVEQEAGGHMGLRTVEGFGQLLSPVTKPHVSRGWAGRLMPRICQKSRQ